MAHPKREGARRVAPYSIGEVVDLLNEERVERGFTLGRVSERQLRDLERRNLFRFVQAREAGTDRAYDEQDLDLLRAIRSLRTDLPDDQLVDLVRILRPQPAEELPSAVVAERIARGLAERVRRDEETVLRVLDRYARALDRATNPRSPRAEVGRTRPVTG